MSNQYGLIFDVDGVIADTEAVNRRITVQVFEDLFGIRGVKPEDFNEGLGRGAEEYIKAGARANGLNLTDKQVRQAARLRQDYFLQALKTEPLPPYPGVLELIRQGFANESFKLAIATSGTLEKSRAALTAAQIPYQKMVYINGSMVADKKPHPALFLTAAQHLDMSPGRCVVIEDAPNGVQAAKAAGTKCIAVTNTTPADQLNQADLLCSSLEQVSLETIRKLID